MLNAKTRLRDMRPFLQASIGIETVGLVPEVQHALTLWGGGKNCVLIGGLALSFYTKPRYTQDVDVLFLHDTDIPKEKVGFKRTRPHSFLELETHVEVETLSSSYLSLPSGLAAKVFSTAISHGEWLVASREALIALKLQRASRQDLADIEKILLPEMTMLGWFLTEKQLATFHAISES